MNYTQVEVHVHKCCAPPNSVLDCAHIFMYDQEDFGGGFSGGFAGGFGGGNDHMNEAGGYGAPAPATQQPDRPRRRDVWRPAVLSQFKGIINSAGGETPLDGDAAVLVVRVLKKQINPSVVILTVTDSTSAPVEAKVFSSGTDGTTGVPDVNRLRCETIAIGSYVRLFATPSLRSEVDDSARHVQHLNLLVQRLVPVRDHNEIPYHMMQVMLVEAESKTGIRISDLSAADGAAGATGVKGPGGAFGGGAAAMKADYSDGAGAGAYGHVGEHKAAAAPATAVFEYIRIAGQSNGVHFTEIMKGCPQLGDPNVVRGAIDELVVRRSVSMYMCIFERVSVSLYGCLSV